MRLQIVCRNETNHNELNAPDHFVDINKMLNQKERSFLCVVGYAVIKLNYKRWENGCQ